LTRDFGRPVLLLEGDSHVFRVDRPFTPGDSLYGTYPGAADAPGFTRVVVEGSANPTEYLRLRVDPRRAEVFTWERVPLT
jgi:hypothetical protein